MIGRLIRHLEPGCNGRRAVLCMLMAVLAISSRAVAVGTKYDSLEQPAYLSETLPLEHEHLKTKLRAGTPLGATCRLPVAADGDGINGLAPLLFQKPVLGEAPANDPTRYDHLFDLAVNQFVVWIPPGAEALTIKLQGRTRTGDLDLAVRFSRPVQIDNLKLICDYRDDSEANDFIASTITPNRGTQPLLPGPWYIAVGNGAVSAADYTLSADVAYFGAPVDEMMLQIDDGSYDQHAGFATGCPRASFLNRLTPPSYPATLKSVHIYHGQQGGLAAGERLRVLAGANPSGISNIQEITLERVPASIGFLNGFNRYDLPKPLTLWSGDFIVGYEVSQGSNAYPAYQDSSDHSQLRSFVSSDGLNFTPIEQLGAELRGNFGIRASISMNAAGSGSANGIPWLLMVGDPFGASRGPEFTKQIGEDARTSAIAGNRVKESATATTRGESILVVKSGYTNPLSAAKAQPLMAATDYSDGIVLPSPRPQAPSPRRGEVLNSGEEARPDDLLSSAAKASLKFNNGPRKPSANKGTSAAKASGPKRNRLSWGLWLAAIGGVFARMASFIIGKR